jgi:hypothetical protein
MQRYVKPGLSYISLLCALLYQQLTRDTHKIQTEHPAP